jgi:predicted aldo/keto reductase-like oxidoreductase
MAGTISTISGKTLHSLGLAAYQGQARACVPYAIEQGINYLFFYGLSFDGFVTELAQKIPTQREHLVIASGSEARDPGSLETALSRQMKSLNLETLDIFFAEYVAPSDDDEEIFGRNGTIALLQQWKNCNRIRYVGASCHSRELATRLIADGRIDVLMHRYNMAHRRSENAVFPAARRACIPIVAFTATRWGTLLRGHRKWPAEAPTAAECYRFCLAKPAIHVVLSAPTSLQQLKDNLAVMQRPQISPTKLNYWQNYGDLIYGDGSDAFETQWP